MAEQKQEIVKKPGEIKSLIEKIILDHVQYSCSTDTFLKLNPGSSMEIVEDMELRRNLINHIRNGESHLAYFYLKENESLDVILLEKLATLSFIDLLSKGLTIEAIEFARDHSIDKSVVTLVGYGTSNEEEFTKICQSINKDEVMSQINSHLYNRITGRKESLLHGTVSYFNTLLNNKE